MKEAHLVTYLNLKYNSFKKKKKKKITNKFKTQNGVHGYSTCLVAQT